MNYSTLSIWKLHFKEKRNGRERIRRERGERGPGIQSSFVNPEIKVTVFSLGKLWSLACCSDMIVAFDTKLKAKLVIFDCRVTKSVSVTAFYFR